MKKWVIVMFVLLAIFVAGCSSSEDDGSTTNTNSQVTDNQNVVQHADDVAGNTGLTADETNKQMDLVDDCEFLNASDVKAICGSDVSMTKDDEIYGPCTFSFTNDANHKLKMIYYPYPPDDSKDRMYNYCLTNGDKVDDFICADSDNNVYVYGDYYSISLGQEMNYASNPVCSLGQLKELGKLVKKRIYS